MTEREEYINGTVFPDVIARDAESFFRKSGRNIAAIDFGTTCCSLAYLYEGHELSQTVVAKLDRGERRVPTSILIKDDGEILNFGKEAIQAYGAIDPEVSKEYHLFSQVKMDLLRENDVTISTVIEAENGLKFYLMEVIAMMLKHIVSHLLNVEMNGNTRQIDSVFDFDWVITVPAIWKAGAKQMMREAAYLAGIASREPSIKNLQKVTVHGKPRIVSRSDLFPDQLSLALEPEAAALYCMYEDGDRLKDMKCCLVLDMGGGTVDATVITVQRNFDAPTSVTELRVVLPPAGNEFGGTKVNAEFKKLLGDLIEEPDFNTFLVSDPIVRAHNKAELDHIVNDIFEDQKIRFGNDKYLPSKSIVIPLPFEFATTYKAIMEEKSNVNKDVWNGVTQNGSRLRIQYDRMKQFFMPSLNAIEKCIDECLKSCEMKVDTLILVGGFGGCNFVHEVLIDKYVAGNILKVYRATAHTTAVVSGAIIFRKDPSIFHARVIDASYGIAAAVYFDRAKHKREYLIRNSTSQNFCDSLFSPFVLKGDTVRTDSLYTAKFRPFEANAKKVVCRILTTPNPKPFYAYEPDSKVLKKDVHILGTLTVPLLKPDKKDEDDSATVENKYVQVTFDFSHTEIQIQAYSSSDEKISTVVDFLCDHN